MTRRNPETGLTQRHRDTEGERKREGEEKGRNLNVDKDLGKLMRLTIPLL
jgi:hypothetical protein